MNGRSEPPETRLFALLVDDDTELCDLLREALAAHDIDAEVANDGLTGLHLAVTGRHDFILLDVMMPGLDGFEVLRRLRRQRDIPVIMLTARTTVADQVTGLDAGADDYLPKPFGVALLLARIRAVLRRAQRPVNNADSLTIGRICLQCATRQATVDDSAIAMTGIEFDILEFLMRASGRVVSRAELSAAILQRKLLPQDRSMDTRIYNIRRKLGRHAAMISTVRGVGYLMRKSDAASPHS